MLRSDSTIKQFFITHLQKKTRKQSTTTSKFTSQYYETIKMLMKSRSMVFQNPLEPPDQTYRFLHHIQNENIHGLLCQYSYKIGIFSIRQLKTVITEQIKFICVVTTMSISCIAKRCLNEISIPITFFCADMLHCNYVNHSLVPLHRRLSDHEKKQLIGRYHAKNLPIYCQHDPIVMYYGWLPGDIIEIIRHIDSTHEPQKYYRIVK